MQAARLAGLPRDWRIGILPKGGFNGIGIAHGVRVGGDVSDQIQFVLAYYSKLDQR